MSRLLEVSDRATGAALTVIKPDLRHVCETTRHLVEAEIPAQTVELYRELCRDAAWEKPKAALPSTKDALAKRVDVLTRALAERTADRDELPEQIAELSRACFPSHASGASEASSTGSL